MFVPLSRRLFRTVLISVCVLLLAETSHAGFLYVLNERNATANQIYGFSVNEFTGALTPLGGFPIPSGGNGSSNAFTEELTIDRAKLRVYVINNGSSTVSAFSINPTTGALTNLPFSPFGLPAGGLWRTIKVHSSGSPLLVGDGLGSRIASYDVASGPPSIPPGSPFSTSTAQAFSSVLSRDGYFYYVGGNFTNDFAGFSVSPATGVLTPLLFSPYNVGEPTPIAYATDSQGRFFTTLANQNHMRVYITDFGRPIAIGGSFTSGLSTGVSGEIYPDERFYYVADQVGNRIGAYQIVSSGIGSMLTAISGSPFNSGGTATDIIAINGGGAFLFAGNGSSRNITTYNITNANGALVFNNIQPADTLGVTGRLNGIGYLPNVVTVLNTNDSGPGSLRQAIADTNMNPVRGGIIKFDPLFFSVPRTIAINEQLIIAGNTSVVGPGAHLLTLRNVAPASAFSRVFVIGARVGVTLSGMTISSGNISGSGFGAGILNTSGAVLKIANCVISENVAGGAGGGLANLDGNTVILINSTVSGNISNAAAIIGGGGIHNSGFMFITNSTISGNVKNGATGGGGIWTDNTLTILDSTITNNQTTGDAGGVYAAGGGVTVRNSIIAGNRNNNLIADVAGQFAATGGGHNLIGNVGTAFGFIQQGDQTGTSAALLDPRLIKVLAYKGGTTPVHMPRGNSPAVDKGTSSSITIDERFLLRPVDIASIPNATDGADIGAVERRATESLFTPPYDFDGDGKTDIGIVRPLSAAEWWVNRSSTGVTFALQFGAMNDRIVPGDYTGDGKADIAFWRPSTGEWFILRSEDFSFFAFPFGTNGDVPAPSDYDADGKTDPTVFRTSNSTWFIAASAGGTIIQQFGVNGDVPVPADYDGDGKSDIAIFRPSNGQWWLNRSTTGTVVVTFGNNADKPVQGDYTADGKVDVAFWRPSTGEWFILRSEDFSFFAFPFGTTGDIPAPGDYDGDGKFDATVFRPSNATWFIGRSTAGTQIVQFGQTGDRPIPNAFVP